MDVFSHYQRLGPGQIDIDRRGGRYVCGLSITDLLSVLSGCPDSLAGPWLRRFIASFLTVLFGFIPNPAAQQVISLIALVIMPVFIGMLIWMIVLLIKQKRGSQIGRTSLLGP